MATRYERGRSAEYRAVKELEAEGFEAGRMAGSHGKYDVIAHNETYYRHIQVKTYIGKRIPNYNEDIQKLMSTKLPSGLAQRELWIRRIGSQGWTAKLLVWLNEESNTIEVGSIS